MPEETKLVGVIGLGIMGGAMAQNLISGGCDVIGFDIDDAACQRLKEAGGKIAEDAGSVVAEAPVSIVSLPSIKAFYTVMEEVAEKGKNKHAKYLRAPVSGSTLFAQEGILTILCSGPKDAYDSCIDLFNVMGKKIFYLGSTEEARYLKLLLNMMVATTSAMTAEALTFGELGGIRWDQMIDVINNSAVAAPQIGFKTQMLKDRDFTPAFSVAQMAKDLDIALNTGNDLNAPMPITSLVRQFLGMMMAQGRGDNDFFALVSLLEELGGFKEHKDG